MNNGLLTVHGQLVTLRTSTACCCDVDMTRLLMSEQLVLSAQCVPGPWKVMADWQPTIGFYRATACNATHVIAVGILSVRLSVCPSDACIVTKLNNALRIF